MKTWTKPVACAVEAGFEVTRYLPAKTWSKPVVATVDAGFEVTRYLPAEPK